MPEPDTPLISAGDFPTALALLTRLPVRGGNRGGNAAWAWPLAGAVVGLMQFLSVGVALALGLQPGVAAAVILGTGMLATGALHEDGLADTADGLWGGADRDRRLAIMKDSHIGSYGTLAMVLMLLIRWSSLTTLCASGWLLGPILATAMLSRVPMAMLMFALPNARANGLSRLTGRPGRETAYLGFGIALLVAALLVGHAAIPATLAAAATTLIIAILALRKLGGQTGDILGAAQVTAEAALLATFAAIL